jgi:hypothetical protein
MIGDSFRTLAPILTRSNLLRQEPIALLGQAAVFATWESELVVELGSDVHRQTDAAGTRRAPRRHQGARLQFRGRVDLQGQARDVGLGIQSLRGGLAPVVRVSQDNIGVDAERAGSASPDNLLGLPQRHDGSRGTCIGLG